MFTNIGISRITHHSHRTLNFAQLIHIDASACLKVVNCLIQASGFQQTAPNQYAWKRIPWCLCLFLSTLFVTHVLVSGKNSCLGKQHKLFAENEYISRPSVFFFILCSPLRISSARGKIGSTETFLFLLFSFSFLCSKYLVNITEYNVTASLPKCVVSFSVSYQLQARIYPSAPSTTGTTLIFIFNNFLLSLLVFFVIFVTK